TWRPRPRCGSRGRPRRTRTKRGRPPRATSTPGMRALDGAASERRESCWPSLLATRAPGRSDHRDLKLVERRLHFKIRGIRSVLASGPGRRVYVGRAPATTPWLRRKDASMRTIEWWRGGSLTLTLLAAIFGIAQTGLAQPASSGTPERRTVVAGERFRKGG